MLDFCLYIKLVRLAIKITFRPWLEMGGVWNHCNFRDETVKIRYFLYLWSYEMREVGNIEPNLHSRTQPYDTSVSKA